MKDGGGGGGVGGSSDTGQGWGAWGPPDAVVTRCGEGGELNLEMTSYTWNTPL